VRFRFASGLALALTAMLAHAQQAAPLHGVSGNTTVLPVLNNENGQVEALLLIEPSTLPQLPSQRIISPASTAFTPNLNFGSGLKLRAGLSMGANPGIGVLCDRSRGVLKTVGSLAGHCLLADFNQPSPLITQRPAVNGLLQLQRGNMSLTGSLGLRRDVLDDPIGFPPIIFRLIAACSIPCLAPTTPRSITATPAWSARFRWVHKAGSASAAPPHACV